ncbi:MAG TPA: TCP-1/cpn60 chaperonin family protein [Anaerolineales bacterium]|nr:TCP-1/cpn60 chaperonin family protein [Anaerolineales bacterium]
MIPAPSSSIPEFKQTPETVFQPRTARGFQGGINKIVDAIRPSLGPFPRTVAIARASSTRSPEFLDSGGIIARRIISLPNRDEDAGAMYIRGTLWNLHERVGDGVATAAVLFQTVFNQGLKYIAAGGSPMTLRHYLEQGADIIVNALDDLTQPIAGAQALTGVAQTVCHDKSLAETLGNLISIVGEEGALEIRAGRSRDIKHELIAGSYWPGALVSKAMLYDAGRSRTAFENAAILITDLAIESPQELGPVIQAAVEAQVSRLVFMCSKISEQAQAILLQSRKSDKLQIIAVKTPGLRSDVQMTSMVDMAVLTGGKILVKAAGDTLAGVTPQHFGHARRIWANEEYTGLVHPHGDPKEIRRHINRLRVAYKNAAKDEERQGLQERIAIVLGGAAAIDVGGLTETEMESRKEIAKRTLRTLRGAAREGILPGGGTALLACRPALDELLADRDSLDARAAHRILNAALEAPFRTLMANSGYSEGKTLGEVEQAGQGAGFDILSGRICEMIPNGIVDVAAVQKQAVISAIRGAALAITIDILIHRRNPPMVTEPDAPGI